MEPTKGVQDNACAGAEKSVHYTQMIFHMNKLGNDTYLW